MTKEKKALITGITGQDGSYLTEFLLSLGYEVHGLIRRASTFNTKRIDHIFTDPHIPGTKLFLHYGDLSDSQTISHIIQKIQPEEIYHLGAQSHVRVSFEMPEYTGNITGLGTSRLLDLIRKSDGDSAFYQASSCEMFGSAPPPQDENTRFKPLSPYACAKLYGYWMTVNYREGYGLYACNGILFNHESPRRGETFVTRKITRGIANILAKRQQKIYLGNLDAHRDWGFSPEYIEMMWKMLQNETPEDFVIGTGEAHSVREFLECAFTYVDLNWEDYVIIDSRYYRPTEPEMLIANPDKAKKKLGWDPKISFQDMVKILVDSDMRSMNLSPISEGDEIIKNKFPNRWWLVD